MLAWSWCQWSYTWAEAFLALDVVSDGAGDVVDCRLHAGGPLAAKQRPLEAGDPLSRRVESSLAQVEHQIWLLRNVLWWYLLPPGLAILTFFAQIAWSSERPDGGWHSLWREWSQWWCRFTPAYIG